MTVNGCRLSSCACSATTIRNRCPSPEITTCFDPECASEVNGTVPWERPAEKSCRPPAHPPSTTNYRLYIGSRDHPGAIGNPRQKRWRSPISVRSAETAGHTTPTVRFRRTVQQPAAVRREPPVILIGRCPKKSSGVRALAASGNVQRSASVFGVNMTYRRVLPSGDQSRTVFSLLDSRTARSCPVPDEERTYMSR